MPPRSVTSSAAPAAAGAADLGPGSHEWRDAVRNLKRMDGVECNTETIALYVQLRASHRRVTPKLMQDFWGRVRHEVSQNVAFETTFWLVPKSRAAAKGKSAELPEEAKPFVIPAAVLSDQLSDTGPTIAWEDYHVVDQACPRGILGMGVNTIRLQLKSGHRAVQNFVDPDSASSSAAATGGGGGAAALRLGGPEGARHRGGHTRGDVSESDAGGPQPSKRPRTLARTYSDPEDVTEGLLDNMKTAADRGSLVSTDPNDNTTLEFWARVTVDTLVRRKTAAVGAAATTAIVPYGTPPPSAAASAALNMTCNMFPRFLSKLLLERDSYASLSVFANFFSQLEKAGIPLPRSARFILQMTAFQLGSDAVLDTGGAELCEIQTFFDSPLYAAFMARRNKARFDRAVSAASSAADRDKTLEELANVKGLNKELAAAVATARSLFNSKLDEKERFKFVLEKKAEKEKKGEVARAAAKWAPSEAIGGLLPFVADKVETSEWPSWDTFAAATIAVSRLELKTLVSHPITKQLVESYESLTAAVGAARARPLQRETAAYRLSIAEWRNNVDGEPFRWPEARDLDEQQLKELRVAHKAVIKAMGLHKHAAVPSPWEVPELVHLAALRKAYLDAEVVAPEQQQVAPETAAKAVTVTAADGAEGGGGAPEPNAAQCAGDADAAAAAAKGAAQGETAGDAVEAGPVLPGPGDDDEEAKGKETVAEAEAAVGGAGGAKVKVKGAPKVPVAPGAGSEKNPQGLEIGDIVRIDGATRNKDLRLHPLPLCQCQVCLNLRLSLVRRPSRALTRKCFPSQLGASRSSSSRVPIRVRSRPSTLNE